MYRSSSWSRGADEYFMQSPPKSAAAALRMSTSMEGSELLAYDPTMEAKKEKSRNKFADNAVHIIPFVLLLCGFILWFFSNPDVDLGTKGESIAAKIEGLTIEGDIDNDSDGTQTSILPGDLEETDKPNHPKDHRASKKLAI